MRYFICSLNTINVGIPAEQTERIIPVTRVQTSLYETETGDHKAFISLPALFQRKDPAPHGVVLKNSAKGPEPPAETVTTILLTPRIDRDLEIPEEGILRLPEALGGWLTYFRGGYFMDQNFILILDPEKIREILR
jgi:hypothetical protein